MKKHYLIYLFILFLFSCGKDGSDGIAYLSFTWDLYVDSYSDNCSDVPSTIYEGEDYRVKPGKYSFEYYCSDGDGNNWSYEGNFTININEGEEGGFFKDGDDGKDNYYTLNLSGSGSSFNLRNSGKEKLLYLDPPDLDLSVYFKIPVGEAETEVLFSNGGEMIVTRQMFQLVKK